MFVDAAFFSVVIECEISVATFSDTGDGTVLLRDLLHNSLRFVRGTSVHQTAQCCCENLFTTV